MKILISSFLCHEKKPIFTTKCGVFLRVFSVLFFLIQVQFLSAQKSKNVTSATISVSEGTTIVSADESFNQQIKQEKIKV